MNKYLSLDFSLDAAKIKDLQSFSLNTDNLEQYGISNADYHHKDFPFYTDDDKNVIAHAAWIIQKLKQTAEKENAQGNL